jgi:hypothetical protein
MAAACTVACTVAALLVPLTAVPAYAAPTPLADGTVEVVSGGGVGDGGPATGAKVSGTRALAYAPDGDLVVAENYRVRRIDTTTGVISTVAGTGTGGPAADGPAASATFTQLSDVAVATDGTVYVADYLAGRVRAISGGTVTTVAGGGATAPADGGSATGAALGVRSVAVGPDGALYVGTGGYVNQPGSVWRVASGTLTRIVGGSTFGAVGGMAFSGADLLFTDAGGTIRRVTGAAPGAAAEVVASALDGAGDLAVASDGSLVFGQQPYGVRSLTLGGTPTTVDQGGGDAPCGFTVAVDAVDHIAAACSTSPATIARLNGDGTTTLLAGAGRTADGTPAAAAYFDDLRDATRAADGTVYLIDGYEVRSIGTDGLVHTVAGTGVQATTGATGDGGPALAATFEEPRSLAAAPDGSLYLIDANAVRRIVPGGDVTHVAGAVSNVAPDEGVAASGAFLPGLTDVAVGATGDVFLTYAGCATLRIDSGGLLHPLAQSACSDPYHTGDVAIDGDGRPVFTRPTSVGYAVLFRNGTDGVPVPLDPYGAGRGVAVAADGTVQTIGSSLRTDGSRANQRYRRSGADLTKGARLEAEPGGTLLAVDQHRLLRLTPATQAVAPAVTGLTVTGGAGTLAVAWDPSPSADVLDYRVRITPGSTPAPVAPAGYPDTTVSPGEHAVTLYRGNDPGTPVDYPGLHAGQPYTVAVWAETLGGLSVPVAATATPTADTTPPANATVLTATVTGGDVAATWVEPTDPDLYGTAARLTTGSAAATSLTDGADPYGPLSGETHATWVNLADGTYTVTVLSFDVSGNVAATPPTFQVTVDRTPPAPATGLALTVVAGHLVATWTAPGADAATVTARVYAGGALYPDKPADGTAPVSATRSSADFGVPQYGTTYRLSVFTTDARGNTGAPAILAARALRAAALDLTVSKPLVTYGGHSVVTGTLRKAGTTTPLPGQRVELWGRRHATGSYTYAGYATTSATGRVTFDRMPGRDTDYQLRHPVSAASDVAAVTSAAKTIWVAGKVTATLSRTTVPHGLGVGIVATLAPARMNAPLTLQRFYGGAWHSLVTGHTGGTSRVTFTVHPATAGTYYYRVYFPGSTDLRPGATGNLVITAT